MVRSASINCVFNFSMRILLAFLTCSLAAREQNRLRLVSVVSMSLEVHEGTISLFAWRLRRAVFCDGIACERATRTEKSTRHETREPRTGKMPPAPLQTTRVFSASSKDLPYRGRRLLPVYFYVQVLAGSYMCTGSYEVCSAGWLSTTPW